MKVYILEREECYDPLVYCNREAAVKAMMDFIEQTKRVAVIRVYESQEDESEPFKQVEYIDTFKPAPVTYRLP